MSPTSRIIRGGIVAAGTMCVLHGCGKSEGKGDTTAARAKKPDPAAVIALAQNYQFVDAKGPVDATTAIPNTGENEADAPSVITIARAVATISPAPSTKVILALVHSDKPYKRLGIEVGDTYIWRDQTDPDSTKWETYMVPASAGSDPKKLKRDTVEYSGGDHKQPRLVRTMNKSVVTFGVCLDDPVCGSGHCGYGALQ